MMKLLGWIGRQKARALAVIMVISILLPFLGAILKPYVTHAVFGLLSIAFLRLDVSKLQSHIKKSVIVVLATIWTTFLIPLFIILICYLTGFHLSHPDLYLGLMLQAIASPMTSAPAIAVLMGLDATLVLLTLVLSSLLVPLSAPVFASMAGLELTLSPLNFGLKLLCILAGSALVGFGLRKLVGSTQVSHHAEEIDGVNILILFIFVAAVMGDVGRQFINNPLLVISLTVVAFFIFFIILGLTYLIFKRTGAQQSFALGMLASQRNMGLMLAGTSGMVPEITWLYFAVSQFPLYLSPLILRPVVKSIKSNNQQRLD